jgi:hypothetical protein
MSPDKSGQSMSVFGVRPVDSISLPNIPYSVRLNCKLGGIFVGGQEDIHRRTKSTETVDIAIIKVAQYHGALGLDYVGQWLQIFFVPAPNVDPKVLPKNTVCVCYIKKQNIANLFTCVQDAMSDKDPGMGIFTIGFEKQAGKDNSTYYTVNFKWRERSGAEEDKQLQQIFGFLATKPTLIDLEGTRAMQCLEGLSSEEVTAIISGSNDNTKLLPGK